MGEGIIPNEPVIRIAIFAAVFAAVALWETLAPRRARLQTRGLRWESNLGILALDIVFVRLIVPVGVVGVAVLAEDRGWGLLPLLSLPFWVEVVLSVLILDVAIYGQHVVFHHVPFLWRLHRMHHADLDFDVTTGLRFHPIEILISVGIKLAIVVALAPVALGVLIFEVMLNAGSMFNHANGRLPLGVDRVLRGAIVTPDMHRIHHSVAMVETNSNFGFNLSVWDRLFHTYRSDPAAGHDRMTVGVEHFADPGEQRLDRLLTQPFRDGAS